MDLAACQNHISQPASLNAEEIPHPFREAALIPRCELLTSAITSLSAGIPANSVSIIPPTREKRLIFVWFPAVLDALRPNRQTKMANLKVFHFLR